MNIEVKNLEKSQVELKVEMPYADLKPFIEKAAQKISQNLKVDGFRSGKIPLIS
jgi:trigger factor